MKKFFIIAALVAATSCVTVEKPAYTATTTYIDYGSITARTGVFLTEATSVSQQYDGLGSVTVMVQDGYEVLNAKQAVDTVYDAVYGYTYTRKAAKNKYGAYKYASPEEAVTLAANKARQMGANGIINLKIQGYPSDRYAILVTGMAIKTK